MAEPFAELGDYTSRWGGVDSDLEGQVGVLLAVASRRIRAKVKGIDERTDLDPELIKDVACEMVRDVIAAPSPGATSTSVSLAGVSQSVSYSEAIGRMRLTRAQLDILRPVRSRARAGSVSSLPPDYGRTPASGCCW